MSNNYSNLRSNIHSAKNLGSSKHGSDEWWKQRLTAIFMVPLVCWLVWFVICNKDSALIELKVNLSLIYNLVPAIMLASISLYHGMIGMFVIYEDYIKCLKLRYSLIIFTKFVTYFTIISLTLSIISLITKG